MINDKNLFFSEVIIMDCKDFNSLSIKFLNQLHRDGYSVSSVDVEKMLVVFVR